MREEPEERDEGASSAGQDHDAEAAPAVGEPSGEAAAENGGGVEQDEQLKGNVFGKPLVQRVTGDVGDWYKQGELEEEDGEGGRGVDLLAEGEDVDDRAGLRIMGDARADEGNADEAEDGADDADDLEGAVEADALLEVQDDDWEQHPADPTGGQRETGRQSPALHEPVSDADDCGREDEATRDAAKNPPVEHILPVV